MFLSYSSDYVLNGSTLVDNLFLSEYMPKAPDMCVKVYMYGLFLCGHSAGPDNELNGMARELELTESDVISAFTYWQELGLVTVLNISPVEVRYLPVKRALTAKKYSGEKYAEFNRQIEQILERAIMPNEFHEYYYAIESQHFEPQAFLMIAKYCADLKGSGIGYKYILTVARSWASAGITTCARVEEKILEYDKVTEAMTEVFKAMGSKKRPDVDDRAMYLKWSKSLEFSHETIIYVAAQTKKAGALKLDAKLNRYYEAKIMTVREIEEFEAGKDRLYSLARRINKIIGVHYEQVDFIIEKYIAVWLNQGFEDTALEMIAEACFKSGVRTLEGLNNKVADFYKQGLLSADNINGYMGRLSLVDDRIRAVHAELKISGNVTTRDRDSYRTWTYTWGFDDEVIKYSASLAAGAAYPFAYMNKILGDWHSRKITTLEQAKAAAAQTVSQSGGKPAAAAPVLKQSRAYTQEEFSALIDDISRIG